MKSTNFQSLKVSKQGKYSNLADKKIIFLELFLEPQNSKMLHFNTGIPREAICRRKRELENEGLLSVMKMDYCPYSGRLTQFMTTNPQTLQRWLLATEKH